MRINDEKFFTVDADKLAVALLGKTLVRKTENTECRYLIAETECYMGVEDTACHAARKNPVCARPLWERGGTLYVRLIYGLYYMLNIVAGGRSDPMGVLIRGAVKIIGKDGIRTFETGADGKGKTAAITGPGRLTQALQIGKDFNNEDLLLSDRIWIEDTGIVPKYTAAPRVGIGYAEKRDRDALWRFLAYDYFAGGGYAR